MKLETLPEIVAELTDPHPRELDGVLGTEEALLVLLRGAVGSSLGRGSAPGGSGTGAPLDLTAMELWARVELYCAPELARGLTVVEAVRYLGEVCRSSETEPAAVAAFRAEAEAWRAGIRDLLEPVRTTYLRGVSCPRCGHEYVRQWDGLDHTVSPAIQVTYLDPPVAVCRVCLSAWSGGELVDLGAGRS